MLTLVVGAQYGGEGKGKICAYLGKTQEFAASCRGGGVNSSHTVITDAFHHRVRLLPAACLVSVRPMAIFGAGTLLHIPTLMREIATTGVERGRIFIDPHAGIVLDEHVSRQRADARYADIGSTLTGTGYASSDRCQRRLKLARDFSELSPFLRETQPLLKMLCRDGGKVLVEGHQGYGLSNYHGDYPYCSSRDTTTAALLSEIGAPPQWAERIILAVKVFPTRNHGGRLPGEVSSTEADALNIREYGGGSWGVDDRRRRVARLCLDDLAQAITVNGATEIALTGIDYLEPKLRGHTTVASLPASVSDVIRLIENLGCPVRFLSTGPETNAMIELTDELRQRSNLEIPPSHETDNERCKGRTP